MYWTLQNLFDLGLGERGKLSFFVKILCLFSKCSSWIWSSSPIRKEKEVYYSCLEDPTKPMSSGILCPETACGNRVQRELRTIPSGNILTPKKKKKIEFGKYFFYINEEGKSFLASYLILNITSTLCCSILYQAVTV